MKNRVILPQVSRIVLWKLVCLTSNIGYIVQVSLIATKVYIWQWISSLPSSDNGDIGIIFNGNDQKVDSHKKKPGVNCFSISPDLTNKTYSLFKTAHKKSKEMDGVIFVCAEVNCFHDLRLSSITIRYFSIEYEFSTLHYCFILF